MRRSVTTEASFIDMALKWQVLSPRVLETAASSSGYSVWNSSCTIGGRSATAGCCGSKYAYLRNGILRKL